MTTDARLLNATPQDNLRPFDLGRDLKPVADLIEQCFADTLGEDGQRYVRQMRSAARNPRFLRWATNVSEYVSLPLTGFVWEEAGEIVGNLSLIPFNSSQGRIYLIANVAVRPDFRRRGIARGLTANALEFIQARRRVRAVWLHVRLDNPPAIHLYQTLGFHERARRTAWRRGGFAQPKGSERFARLQARRARHWLEQRLWLRRLYPAVLDWNQPLNLPLMQPGFQGALRRMLTGTRLRHWSAVQNGRLLGVLTWQFSRTRPDRLWLAAPPQKEGLAVHALIGQAQAILPARRPMTLDFPADTAGEALLDSGFSPEQTLIWMEKQL